MPEHSNPDNTDFSAELTGPRWTARQYLGDGGALLVAPDGPSDVVASWPEELSLAVESSTHRERLLVLVPSRALREQLASRFEILGALPELGLSRVLGSSRNDEEGLVPADTLNAWTDSELDELLRAGPDRPEEEWDLTRVMAQAIERDGAVLRRTIDSVAEIRSIFQSAPSVGQSQSMDSRHVQIEEHLWWDGLVLIFGDDAGIRRAVSRLRESEGSTPIVLLVEKYLDGWRPREWPGDD